MRKRFAICIVFAALGVTGYDIASGLEHWPFGSYPMYSLTSDERLSWLRLYGVSSDGEVELRGDRQFLPFDDARLIVALENLMKADPSGLRVRQALWNLMELHNRRSQPRIRALRLYSVAWTLRPGMDGRELPAAKTLVASTDAGERP
jgi:hypothetical protein